MDTKYQRIDITLPTELLKKFKAFCKAQGMKQIMLSTLFEGRKALPFVCGRHKWDFQKTGRASTARARKCRRPPVRRVHRKTAV